MPEQSKIGDWWVNWQKGWIARSRAAWAPRRYLDTRVLAVFQLLAARGGETVSVDEILQYVWSDRVVSRDSVATAIYQLRRALGDDSHRPDYVRTEGRSGYRLVAPVKSIRAARRANVAAIAAAILMVTVVASFAWNDHGARKQHDPLLFVEQLEDRTQSPTENPLHAAIESSLLGELVHQLPGRVVENQTPENPALALRSTIVACDLGPALVVNLIEPTSNRHLWSQAYPISPSATGDDPKETTLVRKVARDVSRVVHAL